MKKILFSLLLLPALLVAQVPDPMPNTYINDIAKVLTPGQIQTINDSVRSLERRSSVQLAILIINDLPANMEIDDYTLAVGRKWHVGNANNGLVYVVALNNHKQRLEVANNLQGDIPDITALSIIDEVKPLLHDKLYFDAINKLIQGVNSRVDPVAKEQLRLAEIEKDKSRENAKQVFINIGLVVLSIGVIFLVLWFGFLREYYRRKAKDQEAIWAAEEEEERKSYIERIHTPLIAAATAGSYIKRPKYEEEKKKKDDDDDYVAPSYSSRSSDDDNFSSNSSNNDGDWGSGSSGSSDSGFSGGGASGDF